MRIPKSIICEGKIYHVNRIKGNLIDDGDDDFTYACVNFKEKIIELRKGVKKTITEEGFLHELIHLCEDNNNKLAEKIVDDFARRLYEILKRNNLFSPSLWIIPQKLTFEAHTIDIIKVDHSSKNDFSLYDIDKSLLRIRIKKNLSDSVTKKLFFLIIMELCDSETHPIRIRMRDKIAKKLYTLLSENGIINTGIKENSPAISSKT